jgi:glycosyltransferase involved in cell wall biosynthesis
VVAAVVQAWRDLRYALRRGDRRAQASGTPTVSIIIPAYNEERVIEGKLKNALALDYHADKLEVIVVSDGSTDRTAEIVGEFARRHSQVRLLDFSERRGKLAALNEAVREANGEVLVFSDANTAFARDAVKRLTRHFRHPEIGAVCGELRQCLWQASRELGIRAHNGGTYVNMEGPAFSTRAESLANHRQGFSVIGMTNLGEARCAREAEIAYATLAMVTDYDAWKTGESAVTIERVVANLHKNAATAQRLLARVLPRIPAVPDCSCHHALQNALLTDRKLWPAVVCRQLRPLLK